MANKKISQLSATTESNDNVWLVVNNSGNTETFRIKRSDLLSGTSQPQTIEISGFTDTNGNNFTTTNDVFPSQPNTFNTTALSGGRGFINYGYNNSVGSNAYIFGANNTSGNNYAFGGLIIGDGNTFITDGMIIGRNNTEGRGFVFGNNNIGSGNNFRNLKIGNNNNSSNQEAITIGYFNNNQGAYSFIAGSNNINSYAPSSYNTIISNSSQITAGFKNSVFGGYNSDITSTEDNNTILNCDGSLISGTTSGTTLIGLFNFTSPTNDNTTYVDNIHTLRTETFDTISGGSVSGNIDVDLSLGTLYKFTITGNTSPNFINWREGQRMTFVVVNAGTHSVPTMTITGGGSVYVKNGSVNITNNGITKYTGVIIDGDLYLDEQLDFQAL